MHDALQALKAWDADHDATCRPARRTRDQPRPGPDAGAQPERPPTSTPTRRWPRRCWRSSRTSPASGWDQPPGCTRSSTPPRWSSASRRWPPPWGWTTPPPQGSLTPVEQDQLAPDQPLESVLESIVWPVRRDRLRRGRGAAGAAPGRRRRDPRGPGPRRGVRPRAPRPAGGPHRRRAPPAAARRTAPCACAPTTTPSRWWVARTWFPPCWSCCAPRWTTRRSSR